jgi:phosphoribosylamine--glycine ligase
MGAFSPVDWIDDSLVRQVEAQVVAPTLAVLRSKGISYRGTLFSGVMMDGGLPHCLEFNVRMGDPETQAIMMRIENGYAAALLAAATGQDIPAIEISPYPSITVVIAAKDYPLLSSKGSPITLGTMPAGTKLFHAGTAVKDGHLVTNGGRIFAASARAETLDEARDLAYKVAGNVAFEGARFRSDI